MPASAAGYLVTEASCFQHSHRQASKQCRVRGVGKIREFFNTHAELEATDDSIRVREDIHESDSLVGDLRNDRRRRGTKLKGELGSVEITTYHYPARISVE